SWTAQAEAIAEVLPDLVLASVPYQSESVIEILKTGVPVLLLAPRSLDDIYKDIAMIAGVMGVPDRAESVIHEMKGALLQVEARTAHLPRVRVFCEEWGKPIIASQPWVAELIRAAGGIPIGEPGRTIDPEAIRTAEPDVLIASWCGAGNRVPLEKIARDRQWLSTPAALNARFYCINDELLNTPGPSLMGGLRAIAHAIHPDLFPAVPGIRSIAAVAP
ncbi:MAG: ABC transporter substrate-binding protein, partial [Terriglobales bacterium]